MSANKPLTTSRSLPRIRKISRVSLQDGFQPMKPMAHVCGGVLKIAHKMLLKGLFHRKGEKNEVFDLAGRLKFKTQQGIQYPFQI